MQTHYCLTILLLSYLMPRLHCQNLSEIPVLLNKCCGPGQTLDKDSLTCKPLPEQPIFPSYKFGQPLTIEPPFLSQDALSTSKPPEPPPFIMEMTDGLPQCDPDREDLSALLHNDNDLALTEYVIDDRNETGSPFGLVDLIEYEKYEIDNYCLETGYTGQAFLGTAAVYCRLRDEITCQTRPCVSLCCDKQMYFDSSLNKCVEDPHTSLTKLPFVDDDGEQMKVPTAKIRYFWNQKNLISESCPGGRTGIWTDFSLLGTSGRVRDMSSNEMDYSNYCLGRIGKLEPNKTTEDFPIVAIVCTTLKKDDDTVSKIVIPILLIISLIFLGLLFAYIYFKPDNLHPQARAKKESVVAMPATRTNGGKVSTTQRVYKQPLSLFELIYLSLIAMLFMFYAFLIAAKFAWWPLMTKFFPGCIAIGVAIQGSFLSAHFWLNAMNYTVWHGLRKMRVSEAGRGQSDTSHRNRRYRWYAAYAWGIPLAMVVFTLVMQLTANLNVPPEYLPGIGVNNCLLSLSYGVVFYQNVLIGPLIGLNIIFFLLSAWNLVYGVWKDKKNLARRNKHKARNTIVIKMFFAMGLPWIAEVISYTLERNIGHESIKWYIFPFDIINALQGLIIFCVVFFDSNKLEALKKLVKGESGDDTSRKTSNLVTMNTSDDRPNVNSHRARKVTVVTPPKQDQLDTIKEEKV